MKLFLGLLAALLMCHLFAQTPMIMHKRMGGSTENYLTNLQNPHAPIRQSNFGLPPTVFVRRAVIDSVIVVNDSSVLVVTSHRIVEEFGWENYFYDTLNGHFVCTDSMIQKSLTYDSTGTWQPGRDLMINHAVFNPNSTCEKILHTLRWEYGLSHSTSKVVFIGFDCSPSQEKSKQKKGAFGWLNFHWPKDPNHLMLLALIPALFYFMLLQIKSSKRLQIS